MAQSIDFFTVVFVEAERIQDLGASPIVMASAIGLRLPRASRGEPTPAHPHLRLSCALFRQALSIVVGRLCRRRCASFRRVSGALSHLGALRAVRTLPLQ